MTMRSILYEFKKFSQIDLQLKRFNKSTYPKIPVESIFKNKVAKIPTELNELADQLIDQDLFENLPEESVSVDDIVPTQKIVTINNLKSVYNISQDTKAYLIKDDKLYYIKDGHHRIAINILKGETEITAYILGKL